MNIIRAQLEHTDLIAPLFDAYRQFYKAASDLEASREFIHQRLAKEESIIFLALDDDKAIGFVQLYPSFWSVAACRSWILNDLFVSPSHRGTGAGKALMDRARAHAMETGAGGLSLATQRTNHTAQRLYESHGWQRDEEFFHYELPL